MLLSRLCAYPAKMSFVVCVLVLMHYKIVYDVLYVDDEIYVRKQWQWGTEYCTLLHSLSYIGNKTADGERASAIHRICIWRKASGIDRQIWVERRGTSKEVVTWGLATGIHESLHAAAYRI